MMGRCIVADALYANNDRALLMISRGAFHLFTVEGSQLTLRDTLASCDRMCLAEHGEEGRRHGRNEIRRIRVMELLDAEGRPAQRLPGRDLEAVAGLNLSGLRVAPQAIREVTNR